MDDVLFIKFIKTLSAARWGNFAKSLLLGIGSSVGIVVSMAAAARVAGAPAAQAWCSAACAGAAVFAMIVKWDSPGAIATKLDRAVGSQAFRAAYDNNRSILQIFCARDALRALRGASPFQILFHGSIVALTGPLLGGAIWAVAPTSSQAAPSGGDNFTITQLSAKAARTMINNPSATAVDRALASELLTIAERMQQSSAVADSRLQEELLQKIAALAKSRGIEIVKNPTDTAPSPTRKAAEQALNNINNTANGSANNATNKNNVNSSGGAQAGGADRPKPDFAGPSASNTPSISSDPTAKPLKSDVSEGGASVTVRAQSWPARYDVLVTRYFALQTVTPTASQPSIR